MSMFESRSAYSQAIAVKWADRWTVYQRLQELQIPCCCNTNRPLQVEIESPTAAIQLWSVVRQITTSRSELISWLNECWHQQTNVKE